MKPRCELWIVGARPGWAIRLRIIATKPSGVASCAFPRNGRDRGHTEGKFDYEAMSRRILAAIRAFRHRTPCASREPFSENTRARNGSR